MSKILKDHFKTIFLQVLNHQLSIQGFSSKDKYFNKIQPTLTHKYLIIDKNPELFRHNLLQKHDILLSLKCLSSYNIFKGQNSKIFPKFLGIDLTLNDHCNFLSPNGTLYSGTHLGPDVGPNRRYVIHHQASAPSKGYCKRTPLPGPNWPEASVILGSKSHWLIAIFIVSQQDPRAPDKGCLLTCMHWPRPQPMQSRVSRPNLCFLSFLIISVLYTTGSMVYWFLQPFAFPTYIIFLDSPFLAFLPRTNGGGSKCFHGQGSRRVFAMHLNMTLVILLYSATSKCLMGDELQHQDQLDLGYNSHHPDHEGIMVTWNRRFI